MEEVEGKGGEQGAELAQQAKEAFDNHRYESCLSTLNKLMELRRNDKRVAHNRAVARYLLSNLTLTDEFRKNLQTLKAQVRKCRLSRSWSMHINTRCTNVSVSICVLSWFSLIVRLRAVGWNRASVIRLCCSLTRHSSI